MENTERIAVIGAGLMGAGIAEVLARAGHDVIIFDADREAARRVADGLPDRVKTAGSAVEAAHGARFVFEAITEDLAIKLELLWAIGEAAPEAIIASTTSSILPSALAAGVASPARFVIAHFFNPATVVPLVEIVPAPTTAPETVDMVARLLADAGKEVVVLRCEIGGFVANRLQAALLREAFAMERDGIASFDDIDRVVRAGLGSRWAAAGPFAIIDLGGLDVWNAICTRLFPELAADVRPPEALEARVASRSLGAKTGSGIYAHDAESDALLRARIAKHFDVEFSEGH